jgi:hypothetical protein
LAFDVLYCTAKAILSTRCVTTANALRRLTDIFYDNDISILIIIYSE